MTTPAVRDRVIAPPLRPLARPRVRLFLTSATGLLLLVFRATVAMGILLGIHLGFVLALFLTIPYGKFVHAVYRYGALVHHAMESRQCKDR